MIADVNNKVNKAGLYEEVKEQEARISQLRLSKAKFDASYDSYEALDRIDQDKIDQLITAIRTIFDHIPDSEPEGELLQQLQVLKSRPGSYTPSELKVVFAFGNPRPSL